MQGNGKAVLMGYDKRAKKAVLAAMHSAFGGRKQARVKTKKGALALLLFPVFELVCLEPQDFRVVIPVRALFCSSGNSVRR